MRYGESVLIEKLDCATSFYCDAVVRKSDRPSNRNQLKFSILQHK